MLPATVDAVVFDCDGLLVDTESRWSIAEAALFAEHGLPFGETEKTLLIGASVPDACLAISEHLVSAGARRAEPAAIEARLLELVEQELASGVELMPGVVELLSVLHGRVPLGVASNSPRSLLAACLQRAGLAHFFDVSVAEDEVDNGKPHPELYLTACGMLGARPAFSLAFEDSRTGATAAVAAGLALVVVPSVSGAEFPDATLVTRSLAAAEIAEWARTVAASTCSAAQG